mmetsp:Transcript_3842/g.5456  ORF Transcript_3842/g.5456 Transcript_3842/m.5456 type:complete len:102 (+) Transcript_3842:352-657(+)
MCYVCYLLQKVERKYSTSPAFHGPLHLMQGENFALSRAAYRLVKNYFENTFLRHGGKGEHASSQIVDARNNDDLYASGPYYRLNTHVFAEEHMFLRDAHPA